MKFSADKIYYNFFQEYPRITKVSNSHRRYKHFKNYFLSNNDQFNSYNDQFNNDQFLSYTFFPITTGIKRWSMNGRFHPCISAIAIFRAKLIKI